MADNTIRMVAPDGTKWDLDPSEVEEAHANGYQLDNNTNLSPPVEESSRLESLGRGALQGATFGFADEISGAAESLFSDKTYQQARDESRANFDHAKESHPGYYLGGEVLGGVATSAAGGAALKGLTTAGRLAEAAQVARAARAKEALALLQEGRDAARVASLGKVVGQAALKGAKIGAVEGGLAGIGNSKAEALSDLAKDGLVGTATGAVGGAVVGGSGAALKKGIEAAGRHGALKAVGGLKSSIRNAIDANTEAEIAKRYNNITDTLVNTPSAAPGTPPPVTLGSNPASSLGRINEALKKTGNQVKIALGKIDDMAKKQSEAAVKDAAGNVLAVPKASKMFDWQPVLKRIETEVVNPELDIASEIPGPVQKKIKQIVDIAASGDNTYTKANKIRAEIRQVTQGSTVDDTKINELLKRVKSIVESEYHGQMSQKLGRSNMAVMAYRKVSKEYAGLEGARDLALSGTFGDLGNNELFTMGGIGMGAGALGGMGHGGASAAAAGLGAMAATAAIRKFGPNAVAVGAKALSTPAGRALGELTGDAIRAGTRTSAARSGLEQIKNNLSSFGKYAKPLEDAYASGGDRALGVRDYLLSQRDPEYRALKKRLTEGTDDES